LEENGIGDEIEEPFVELKNKTESPPEKMLSSINLSHKKALKRINTMFINSLLDLTYFFLTYILLFIYRVL